MWTAALMNMMAAGEPVGIVINQDSSQFYGSRSAEQMTIEGLHAFVDHYVGTKVTHLFWCPNAMRTSYASKVWDPIWELGNQKIPEEGRAFAENWVRNARLLHERGLDPYAVWIARCREKGISPWLSMRMNDIHNVDDPTNYLHSTFWLNHPEYGRVPGGKSWTDRAFDYGIPEVREYHMRLIRELLERYDPDGLELDWMRFGYHIKPGHEKEGCELLTAFMREVRQLTKDWSAKRGHAIKLGARVPAHPDAAAGLAMDGVTWVKEGLVDMLVPTPFWATADFDIPIELWRERLGAAASNIVLAAGQEILLAAHPGAKQIENDLASTRGFAAVSLHRGADQIYLFNYMDGGSIHGGEEAYRTLLQEGLALNVVTHKPRRHVITFRDTVPRGMSNNAQLPLKGTGGGDLRFYIGPAPNQGQVSLIVGLQDHAGVKDVAFKVAVNGTACAARADFAHPEQFPNVARAVQFDCPRSALKDGYNTVRVSQEEDQAEQQIVWAELRIDPLRSLRYTPGTEEEAKIWQRTVRKQLADLLHITDLEAARVQIPLDPEVLETLPREGYTLQIVRLRATPNRVFTAAVARPLKTEGRLPAVVCIHGHGGNRLSPFDHEAGIYKLFGEELARRGFIVISTDVGQHEVYEKGRTLMGERLWDLMRCVDYLQSLPFVDPQRIGCAGLSLGGEMAMWLGAMDERIAATVSAGFLTRMDQMEQNHCMCWKFDGLRARVDFADIYSLIAPRLLQCQNGLREPETEFTVPLAQATMKEIQIIYTDFNAADNAALEVHDGAHEIALEPLIRFLSKHLGKETTSP